MTTLNLGILAHVDAGKTSLTERLLHAAGVIDQIGSVDDGSTQTDTLDLERQRGITIKSAVVSFVVNDVTVNLIDTPGHSDFIAEVDRALGVLDGVVLVVSAVEGVQAQTRVLMHALRRLRVPTLIFVNKIDRAGARDHGVLRELVARLTPNVLAMGSVCGLGTRDARYHPYDAEPDFQARLVDLLTANDEALLAAYVEDEARISLSRLHDELARQTRGVLVHPVFFGSAITGAGTDALLTAVTSLLPSAEGAAGEPVSGTVFKVERGPAGEKIAYARLFAGTVQVRDRLTLGEGGEGKVTAISVFEHGCAVRRASVAAGQIARLWGLDAVQIGDSIGRPRAAPAAEHRFSPPTMEIVVDVDRPEDRGALHVALTQLAEQDPLIGLHRDELRGELSVTLYGEIQKEVIQATLAADYGLAVSFGESTTICIERLIGTGAAAELKTEQSNPFLATVGLRVDPAPIGSGLSFGLAVELGSMPAAFFTAVEETVAATLQQGLYGWEVPDCRLTMTHSGYYARQSHAHGSFDASMSSTAGDFRNLTPLVLMAALHRAGTEVCEPMHRFGLEIPADRLSSTLATLTQVSAVVDRTDVRGSSYHLAGQLPAARIHRLQQLLPAATQGAGELVSQFDHYRPIRGRRPVRPRRDHNPVNRREYLLHVVRRV